ncbi:MAG TPA: grasp-with-spasm system ATP-grasp peptide maturase [Mucilaginibacter sp.]
MILILSTDGDFTTSEVIDCLQNAGAEYFRLNDNDIFRYDITIMFSEQSGRPYFSISTGETVINSNDVDVVWYRKFGFFNNSDDFKTFEKQYGDAFLQQFKSEYRGTLNLICKCLAEKKWLADYRTVKPDKFVVLNKARQFGLHVPKSIVTNNKASLFVDMPPDTIAKSITDISFIETKTKDVLSMYTFLLRPLKKKIPNHFLSTLVQQEIKKEFEIRTFYIDGRFFSMAIFSQGDPQTETDFRKYNYFRPNRFIPYNLDQSVEHKLSVLLDDLGINTGSIDLIYTPEGETVLLEINPCGQFGMMSRPCNYPLEKIVADTLILFELSTKEKPCKT